MCHMENNNFVLSWKELDDSPPHFIKTMGLEVKI